MNVQSPTTAARGAIFQRLRWRMLKNTLRVVMRQSVVRIFTIFLCCALIWGTLFVVSLLGFRELVREWEIAIDGTFFAVVLNLAFVALSILLVFSTGLILYSSLFSAKESAFLLSSPITADQIFAYKYQGAVAFSSWAFILLGSPVLLAYGCAVGGGAPWYYFALLPLFFLGFVLIPGSVGAFICIGLVNFFPRRKKQTLILVITLLVAIAGIWVYVRLLPTARHVFSSTDAVSAFFGEFSLVSSPLMPASWIAEGLRSAAIGDWMQSLYYLALIWSNGLMLYVVLTWLAKRLYRRGYNLLASNGGGRRKYRTRLIDNVLVALVWFLDKPTRMLVAKDFRTFRRDPAQWAQIVIFLGLAIFYFIYMRGFYSQTVDQRFQIGISLLNLTATSFLICAYTGRFIYPMLSLEGKKFWILGLLPMKRSRLLWSKFAFSAVGTILTGEFLVIFSNVMLNTDWRITLIHAIAIATLALGLSGLSVGMGATMPNFRESDPSKIAVGFGGTLNLVLGLLYQVAIICVMVLPWHVVLAFSDGASLSELSSTWWLWVGMIAGVCFGVMAVVLPLRAGNNALKGMEF